MSVIEKLNFLQRFLFLAAYYYGIVIGAISVRIDFKRFRLEQSKSLRIYAFILNAIVIGFTPLGLITTLREMGDNKNLHSLQRLTEFLNGYTRSFVIVLTLLLRLRRERYLIILWNELLDMETKYFYKTAASNETKYRFNRLLYAKCFTIWFQSIAVSIAMLQMSKSFSFTSIMLSIFVTNLQNMMHAVMFHYYSAVWFICKCYAILNEQLLKIIADVRQQKQLEGLLQCKNFQQKVSHSYEAYVADEISTILKLYYRLTALLLGLNATFKFLIMAVRFTIILNQIFLGYTALMNESYSVVDRKLPYIIFGCFTYLMLLADLYLVDLICDTAVSEYQRTAEILKNFHEFTKLEKQLEQSCELFSLQLMQHKLRMNICGMFELNKRSSFILLGETLRQTIILVQFEYESRLRKHS